MLRHLLWIIGLEQWLRAVRDRTEQRAQELFRQGKAQAMQAAIGGILTISAIVVLLMAFVPALVAVFIWLEPQFGNITSLGIVAGILAGLAALLAISAVVALRRRPAPDLPHLNKKQEAVEPVTPVIESAPVKAIPATPLTPVTPKEVDDFLSFAGRFAEVPRTGIEQIDNLVVAVSPKAEEVTKEAIARAATMVRSGDRATVLTILGAAVAAGWLMTKAVGPKSRIHTASTGPLS
jgi:Putative Actinobacterial Holin-X, holin superfamily III